MRLEGVELRARNKGETMSIRRSIIIASAFLLSAPALAHDQPPRYNQVDFSVEVTREVQNDLMNASMFAELNEANAATLTQKLNRIGNDALATAKKYKDVKVRTGFNQTYPVYDKNNKLVGWRGRTEVRLEGKDFGTVSDVIAALQNNMQLGGVNFSISPELRRDVQNELMKEVVASFRQRGELLRQALGAKGYKLRNFNVQTDDAPQPMRMNYAVAEMKAQAMDRPAFEGGTSHIRVGASGGIELVE
jgi:predicted secreted protein